MAYVIPGRDFAVVEIARSEDDEWIEAGIVAGPATSEQIANSVSELANAVRRSAAPYDGKGLVRVRFYMGIPVAVTEPATSPWAAQLADPARESDALLEGEAFETIQEEMVRRWIDPFASKTEARDGH